MIINSLYLRFVLRRWRIEMESSAKEVVSKEVRKEQWSVEREIWFWKLRE